MIDVSVIIPTMDRVESLKQCVNSVLTQEYTRDNYEVIVVDNGLSGSTKRVIEDLKKNYGDQVKYLRESNPGLHNARHKGAAVSKGKILAYLDDDVIVDRKWITVCESFKDPSIHMVGGRIRPKWEVEPPSWVWIFQDTCEFGKVFGYLSLLDFGGEPKRIPPIFAFGCNMMIRKKTLFDCGGFHPDAFPKELIRYRGDGETGLSKKLEDKGCKVIYNPIATVHHVIGKERLSLEYFRQRAFNQGISDSFTEIRRNRGLKNHHLREMKERLRRLHSKIISLMLDGQDPKGIKNTVFRSYLEGRRYHLKEVLKDPKLLEHVLKETWLAGTYGRK
ncbi:MAG: glycosyltransferase [Methanobacteriota archaeon]